MFWFAFETLTVPTIIFQNTRELFDSRAEENPKITCSLETHALAIKSRLFVNERLCWFICCRVRGYNRSARACALVCVRSVSIVCLCVRLGKGQRDTVLHITALQMAVVSGCDSESEWVPTPFRCTLSDLTNTVELKQAPYLSLSLWHTLSILTQPLRGTKSCFLRQEYIKGQEYISRRDA